MTDSVLRDAVVDDLDSLAGLLVQADSSWTLADLRAAIDDNTHVLVVAKHNGSLLGFFYSATVADEETLRFICVDPVVRRLGVGSALMRELLWRAAANGRRVLLEVRRSNLAAIALYETVGFRRDGIRPEYYSGFEAGQREDALLMSYYSPAD